MTALALDDFILPTGQLHADPAEVFASVEFQRANAMGDEVLPLNTEDLKWVEEVRSAGHKVSKPPSLAAQIYLEKHLAQYNFELPVTQTQWQNFVLMKYFEQANDLDPKISKPALDALAKTSTVGLMVERTEVNIVHKSTEELEGALRKALERYAGVKTIEGVAERVG